ncbi:hypothetical protein FOMPIDRAFT_1048078 [Fomitopsis schrenkii]|uniref:Uncharacterized protein n=1 Tax=Fomitopsis schrenkii TaxID=2126942 RepID=S8EBQ0_FOMSC|nr:hypothetical protein FOMPIDRAFT_1048078 [Fomitopsis schrenkii]
MTLAIDTALLLPHRLSFLSPQRVCALPQRDPHLSPATASAMGPSTMIIHTGNLIADKADVNMIGVEEVAESMEVDEQLDASMEVDDELDERINVDEDRDEELDTAMVVDDDDVPMEVDA